MRSLWSSQIFFRSLFIISQIIISIFPSRQLSITLCQQFINITCTQAIHQINILLFSAKRNEAIINWFGTDYRTLQYHVHVASNSDWRDRLLVINRLSYKQTPPPPSPLPLGRPLYLLIVIYTYANFPAHPGSATSWNTLCKWQPTLLQSNRKRGRSTALGYSQPITKHVKNQLSRFIPAIRISILDTSFYIISVIFGDFLIMQVLHSSWSAYLNLL